MTSKNFVVEKLRDNFATNFANSVFLTGLSLVNRSLRSTLDQCNAVLLRRDRTLPIASSQGRISMRIPKVAPMANHTETNVVTHLA